MGHEPRRRARTGNTNDQCEGPALIESLERFDRPHRDRVTDSASPLTSTGDLYCAGDNSLGQCPVVKTGDVIQFTRVPIPELAGNVADVRSGPFHTLILGKDKKLYALGRGRDGQLGTGKMVNGFAAVPEMTDVMSFAAGTWHSVAARADGSVWTWGNDSKSQLCDGATTNRATPAKVTLPSGVRVTNVAAGGHSTLMRTSDGALLGCGDNQFGPLGIDQPIAPQPTPIKTTPMKSSILAIGGANAAISVDGCDVRLTGTNDHGIVAAADVPAVKTFTTRANLSLCSARSATTLDTIVNPAPRGGESNCWAKRVEEDGSASPKFAGLRNAMVAAEEMRQEERGARGCASASSFPDVAFSGAARRCGRADAHQGGAGAQAGWDAHLVDRLRSDSATGSHRRRHRADLDLLQPGRARSVHQSGRRPARS